MGADGVVHAVVEGWGDGAVPGPDEVEVVGGGGEAVLYGGGWVGEEGLNGDGEGGDVVVDGEVGDGLAVEDGLDPQVVVDETEGEVDCGLWWSASDTT